MYPHVSAMRHRFLLLSFQAFKTSPGLGPVGTQFNQMDSLFCGITLIIIIKESMTRREIGVTSGIIT